MMKKWRTSTVFGELFILKLFTVAALRFVILLATAEAKYGVFISSCISGTAEANGRGFSLWPVVMLSFQVTEHLF